VENAPRFYSEEELFNVKRKVTKIVNFLGLVTYRLACGNRAGFDFGAYQAGIIGSKKKREAAGTAKGIG
jgi:hypothetical protein